MARRNVVGLILVTFAWMVLESPVWAQATSGIAGVVRDTSGAVLPGVTVEAASPALIEKVRAVVTNSEGQYNIIDLRPGTFSVTFTLPGFSTFKREGIELSAGFTATVNASMQVGALEETITVTGSAPLIDTQNARQQKVMSSELLTALPTGQTTVVNLVTLIPGYAGTTATVGSSTGAYTAQVAKATFHGKKGGHVMLDGMRIDNYAGSGDSPGYIANSQIAEEMSVETGGAGANSGVPNVGINMIPKEGGNTFTYGISGVYTNHNFQSDNLDDAIRARGLTIVPKIDRIYDAGVTVGGPIKRDRLWFFTAIRRWGTRNEVTGTFYNKTQGTMFYTPDLTRPSIRDERYQSHAVRVTWQVSQKNKVNLFSDIAKDCFCVAGGASNTGGGSTVAPEAGDNWRLWPNGMIAGTLSSPRTNKLLLEAGAGIVLFHRPAVLLPGVEPNHIQIVEQSNNFTYNNLAQIPPKTRTGDRYVQRFALSYVTGSHAFKTGIQWDQGLAHDVYEGLGRPEAKGVSYTFLRGVPVSLTMRALPEDRKWFQKAELGIYAQDQWRFDRLTLNYGVRFDYYNGYIPEHRVPATQFVPAHDFAEVRKAPEWKDINPRLGASYDLFGSGRTALKMSFGRYSALSAVSDVGKNHPITTSVNQVNRPWTDTNGNYIPDCELTNFAANGECGVISNLNFGKANPNATRYADDVTRGFGARLFTWDLATEVQHQVAAGVSVTGGYYHNWGGGFRVVDNLAVTPADYSPYCVTAPVDARLPGGGGYQVCGLYDINPNKFGQVSDLVTRASHYMGKDAHVTCEPVYTWGGFGSLYGHCGKSDFVNLSFDTRLGTGIRFGGGVDTGRTVADACLVVDSPQQLLNCRIVVPLRGSTQVKLNGVYPLPGGFVVAGTFQNLPGLPYTANYTVPTAQIAPSLGRNLSGGVRTATAPLIAPETQREARRTQVDLRLSKTFKVGLKGRLQANFDLYNALNANSVLGQNSAYGAQFRTPTALLGGRLIQFSGNVNF